jgi:hypothetical protein
MVPFRAHRGPHAHVPDQLPHFSMQPQPNFKSSDARESSRQRAQLAGSGTWTGGQAGPAFLTVLRLWQDDRTWPMPPGKPAVRHRRGKKTEIESFTTLAAWRARRALCPAGPRREITSTAWPPRRPAAPGRSGCPAPARLRSCAGTAPPGSNGCRSAGPHNDPDVPPHGTSGQHTRPRALAQL